jgi:cytochrome c peroxidase
MALIGSKRVWCRLAAAWLVAGCTLATVTPTAQPEATVTVQPAAAWTAQELETLRSLWLGSLPPLPPDPSNAYADDPRAAALGERLFFDTRFSSNEAVACATCHRPDLGFQDGLPLARGVGPVPRRTMTVVGTAYSPWLFWDGRKDSQWAQALAPLESAVEHGGDRTLYAHLVAAHYRAEYEAVFGPLPALDHLPARAGPVAHPMAAAAWAEMAAGDREAVTRVFANLGKALAAYERGLAYPATRFDAYVAGLLGQGPAAPLAPDEAAGLRLFIGQAECLNCHSGPRFSNDAFHNTGVPSAAGQAADLGRALGAPQAAADEFNCLSAYSDAGPDDCDELRFLLVDGQQLQGQFRPPSLRGVSGRAPYMHAGQFATLEAVLDHYNSAPPAPVGRSELHPLRLSAAELAQLAAFLRTLEPAHSSAFRNE